MGWHIGRLSVDWVVVGHESPGSARFWHGTEGSKGRIGRGTTENAGGKGVPGWFAIGLYFFSCKTCHGHVDSFRKTLFFSISGSEISIVPLVSPCKRTRLFLPWHSQKSPKETGLIFNEATAQTGCVLGPWVPRVNYTVYAQPIFAFSTTKQLRPSPQQLLEVSSHSQTAQVCHQSDDKRGQAVPRLRHGGMNCPKNSLPKTPQKRGSFFKSR